jgi:hypothetical protein
VHGPEILVRSLSIPQPTGPSRALWQYHSRSDRHSKVACWAVLFDLLQESALLRSHATAHKVVFGLNHEMRDFKQDRKKDLDLVIARPASTPSSKPRTFADLADRYSVELDATERHVLSTLPTLFEGPVGAVLVALEAKAAMTAHSKALPRLYDELNSSHLTVHGSTSQALAIGLVMVNASPTFVSPSFAVQQVNKHTQPAAAASVVAKVKQIPRRTKPTEDGFDGLAIVVVSLANDGTPVTLVTTPPAPPSADIFSYESMIKRVAHEYDSRFAGI